MKIGLFHGVITVMLWTVLLSAPLWIARTLKLVAICGIVSVALTWLTIFPDWILGSGILYADGISTAILLLAYGWLIFGRPTRIRKSVIPMVLCSGAMIGASAYLRSSIEALVLGTTIVLFVACTVSVVLRTVRIRKAEATLKVSRSRRFRELGSGCKRSRLCWVLVAFFVAQAVMLPWRVYLHDNVTSSYSFSTTGDQAFAFGWMPTGRLDPRTIEWGWFLNGFCVAYPARCAAIEDNELRSANPYGGGSGGYYSFAEFRYFAVIDIATDPAPWVQQRGTQLATTWWPQRLNSSLRASLNEGLALAAVAFVVLLSALASRRRREMTPVVLVGTLLLITILLPMLTHFEERYLYPAKALAVFLPYFIADSGHFGLRNWLTRRHNGRACD